MLSAHELSSLPTRIQLANSEYSQHDQRLAGEVNRELTITWNATQTFDYNGRPADNDND
jgi:hypothetical protein